MGYCASLQMPGKMPGKEWNKDIIQKYSDIPWQPKNFDWALLVSLSKYSVRKPQLQSVLSRTGLRECLELSVATDNVEKMGLLRWWVQLLEGDRMKGVNEGGWRYAQMKGGLLKFLQRWAICWGPKNIGNEIRNNNVPTYWKRSRNGIATNVGFVDKVEWGTVVTQRTSLIDVILPIIELWIWGKS